MSTESMYWQLAILDENSLSGDSVCEMITKIGDCLPDCSTWVTHIEGGHVSTTSLVDAKDAPRVIGNAELNEVRPSSQIDWADFYYTPKALSAEFSKMKYEEQLEKVEVLLRCVDNGWFFLYGKDPKVLETLSAALGMEVVCVDSAKDLSFPD